MYKSDRRLDRKVIAMRRSYVSDLMMGVGVVFKCVLFYKAGEFFDFLRGRVIGQTLFVFVHNNIHVVVYVDTDNSNYDGADNVR